MCVMPITQVDLRVGLLKHARHILIESIRLENVGLRSDVDTTN
jgi:hypothetical protein